MGDLFKEGMKKYHEGEYNEAGVLFHQELERDDSNPKVWNALGICLSKTGQYEDAAICFENALIQDPGNETYEKNIRNNKKNSQKSLNSVKPEKVSDSKKKIPDFFRQFIFIIKSLFLDPHGFFRSIKDDHWKIGYRYYFAIIVIYAIVIGIISLFTIGMIWSLGMFILILITLSINPFISSLFLFFGIRIMKGKGGLQNSLNIYIYSSFPSLLFGWIPIIGMAAGLLTLYLQVVGVKEFEKFTTGRAIGAVFIVFVIIIGLILVTLAILFFAVFGLGFFAPHSYFSHI